MAANFYIRSVNGIPYIYTDKVPYVAQTTINELANTIGPALIRAYPLIVYINGRYFIQSEVTQDIIEINIYDDDLINKLGISQAQINSIRSYNSEKIPLEVRNKFCLLFSGYVVYSTNSYEDLLEHERQTPYLQFTKYIPIKK
jgi:hypothetical protein